MRDIYVRKPQPSNWQSVMIGRDGDTGPSVAIYRSKTIGDHSSDSTMMDPSNWQPYEQQVPGTNEDQLKFGLVEDVEIMKGGEQHKQVLIVVKRGKHVDYEGKQGAAPPLVFSRIPNRQLDLSGKSWKEIRAAYIDKVHPHSIYPFNDDTDSDDEDDVTDSYENVNEFSWGPLDHNGWNLYPNLWEEIFV